MPRPKNYSLNTKITLSFIALGFILLAILFIQIIPSMIEEQKEHKKHQMEHMISLTQNQLKFAIQLLINASKAKEASLMNKINDEIFPFVNRLKIDSNNTKSLLEEISLKTQCKSYLLENNKNAYKNNIDDLSKNKINQLEDKKLFYYTKSQKHMCPKKTKSILFGHPINNEKKIVLECSPQKFKNAHDDLEEKIKDDLQKSFKLTYEDHKGKINLIWINTAHPLYKSQPLYHLNDKEYNEKYCLSRMSSASLPQTGELTAQQIIEASNKKPLRHEIFKDEKRFEKKVAFTWVKTLHAKGDRQLVFITTVYEEDFNKHLNEPLLKIMPAAVFALITAILLGLILFRRMFKSINILTHTVKEVNSGNRTIRNDLRGDDDIAMLAKSFDTMLDTIEENILGLDQQVAQKTKQLQNSLEEKETLLKEIHHRVKNNLAMTINLIKLQKSKINDDRTKTLLTDIQERIFTMELLHRKLYESNDLNSISMKKYIKELSDDLNKTYGVNQDIKIDCDIADINTHIEYALPCGLIITECLTNSFKYAFENEEGNIYIKLNKKEDVYSLIIGDDGIGLPKEIDINKVKTLGLRLITSIVKGQLLGSLDYVYDKGSKFYIEFKE